MSQMGYSDVRRLVLDYVRSLLNRTDRPEMSVESFVNGHKSRLKAPDLQLCLQVFHELYLERVIYPGDGPNSLGRKMEWPRFTVTTLGERSLLSEEFQPHDPDGYLKRLKAALPSIDDSILTYAQQSLACFQFQQFLAAAVMLGCAAEKCILLLIDAFGAAITDANE